MTLEFLVHSTSFGLSGDTALQHNWHCDGVINQDLGEEMTRGQQVSYVDCISRSIFSMLFMTGIQ